MTVLVLCLDKVIVFPKGTRWGIINMGEVKDRGTVTDYTSRDIETAKFLHYIYFSVSHIRKL